MTLYALPFGLFFVCCAKSTYEINHFIYVLLTNEWREIQNFMAHVQVNLISRFCAYRLDRADIYTLWLLIPLRERGVEFSESNNNGACFCRFSKTLQTFKIVNGLFLVEFFEKFLFRIFEHECNLDCYFSTLLRFLTIFGYAKLISEEFADQNFWWLPCVI